MNRHAKMSNAGHRVKRFRVSGLHGNARIGSISLLCARRRLESPLVILIRSLWLNILEMSSVIPAPPASSSSALVSGAEAGPRRTPSSLPQVDEVG